MSLQSVKEIMQVTTAICVWSFLLSPFVFAQGSTLQELRPKVQAESKLPLRLPTFLPDTGGQNIYALLRHADPDSYDILLATAMPCEGGNACTYGTVQAQKTAFNLPEGKPTTISLGGGIAGQFFPAECHVFCGEAFVRWSENDVFYSIGVKAGKKGGIVAAAKSALAQR